MNTRTVVLCYAILLTAGSCNSVLAGERSPSSSPNPSEKVESRRRRADIESALMSGKMVSIDLSDKLVEARELWATASPAGRRMLKDFPGKLRDDQEQLSNADDKSINLRVFGSVAAQYIENTTILDDREPVAESPPPIDDHVAQQQVAIAPQATKQSHRYAIDAEAAAASCRHAYGRPQPPAPTPVIASLLDRGNAMMDIGDIAAARLLFRRAADLGSGNGAMKLARTYDPEFLGSSHKVIGIQPDRATAAKWVPTVQGVLGATTGARAPRGSGGAYAALARGVLCALDDLGEHLIKMSGGHDEVLAAEIDLQGIALQQSRCNHVAVARTG